MMVSSLLPNSHNTNEKGLVVPPEWRSGLRYCIAVLRRHYSLRLDPQAVVTGSPYWATHNWPSAVRVCPRGLYLVDHAQVTPCGGPGACRLTSVVS